MRGELVDTDRDPLRVAAQRRARFVRLLFPFLTALFLIAAIVAITIYTERVNRQDALELTDDVIRAIEASLRLEVEGYLSPTATSVTVLAQAVAEGGVSGTLAADGALERLMRGIMRQSPGMASIYAGDAQGDFLMVQREEERLVTKLIAASGGERSVRWIERGRDGAVLAERADPDDRFDPATRPWFSRAREVGDVVWSEVYRFFSTGAAGVTASARVPMAEGAPRTVAGADLEIAAIGAFLDGLDLKSGGRTVLFQGDGRLVAYPPSLSVAETGEVPRIADVDDPVLSEVYQRFRVDRGFEGLVTIDGVRYLVSTMSLAGIVDREWWALLVVPEESFVGFVAANARTSLLLSSGVVVLALVVAGLLTYQGLQSDARAARAERSEARMREQGRALEGVAAVEGLGNPLDDESLRRFAEVTAETLAARRVGIWRLDNAAAALVCLETYERETRAHMAAATLPADHLADAWPLVTGAEPLVVTAEDGEPALEPLRELYLAGAGIGHLEIVPVMRGGQVLGGLWLEDAEPMAAVPGAEGLRLLLASMLAPRLEELARSEGAMPPALAAGTKLPHLPARRGHGARAPAAVAEGRDLRLLEALKREGRIESLGAGLFPRVAVLQLNFGDDIGLARGDAKSEPPGLGRVMEMIETEARRLGIPYLRLAGDTLTVADGFDDEPESGTATHRIADLAIALQPLCREAMRASGRRPGFRFGIDVGPAFGESPGAGDPGFNLWGEAWRLAGRMAESAPPTAIQVSEPVYERLARDYLLRRHGSFFIEGVGETSTYILAGRL